jgi:hypothetical protein
VLLESRLEELVREGDRQDAAELAIAALKNDKVVDVTVEGGAVTVETRRFRGTHDVERGDGDPMVVQRGDYHFKGDLSLSFTTATMHDDALAAAREELGVDAADEGDAADAATRAAADGGEPETDGRGDRGPLSRVVAAVQTLVP